MSSTDRQTTRPGPWEQAEDPTTLTVLIVSAQRSLLRRLGWLLGDFGYRVLTCSDVTSAESCVKLARPPLLMVDETAFGDPLAWIRDLRRQEDDDGLFTVLISDETAHVDVLQAVEAGVDDFLTQPFSHAEVLARLRTGARTLEFQRRITALGSRDSLTRLLSRRGVLAACRREAEQQVDGAAQPLSCVLLELDYFHYLAEQYGQLAAQQLLINVADLLREECDDDMFPGRCAEGRFCVMLPNRSVEEARKWAEGLRERLTTEAYTWEDIPERLTASFGIAGRQMADQDVADFIDRAHESLQTAVLSGRNCLAQTGDFSAERSAWRDCLASGNPFSDAKARDVMTPFTHWLHAHETVGDAVAKLEGSQLQLLPVLNPEGHLLGLVRQEDVTPRHKSAAAMIEPINTMMVTDFVRIGEQSDFSLIMEHFFANDQRPVVVFRDQLPLGFLTLQSFGALVAPVKQNTFAVADPESESLLVPDSERDFGAEDKPPVTIAETSGLADRLLAQVP